MFKKICNFIIMITCVVNILSLFIYPIYQIQDVEILKAGVYVETLEECGYIEENNNSLSSDIYVADIIMMLKNYIKYDLDVFKSIEGDQIMVKLIKLFDIWLNPLPLMLILLICLVVIITLIIIFIKSLIASMSTFRPKIFLGLIETIFFTICLINLSSIIPNSYISNVDNVGTISVLTMLVNSKSSLGLTVLFWGIVFTFWVGLAERVFGEPSKQKI